MLKKTHIAWTIGVAIMMIVTAIIYVNGRMSDEKDSPEGLLSVRNNTVFVDDLPIYRMAPVDGGDLLLGGFSDIFSISGQSVNRYLYAKKRVDSFIIGETPVNLALWNYVMFDYPSRQSDNVYSLATEEEWMEFISKLNLKTGRVFRLPTNDEWEYAARGGRFSKGYRYAGSDVIDEVAIYKGNLVENPDSISVSQLFFHGKLKKPNELGLYDMCGSVWEITSTPLYKTDPSLLDVYTALIPKKKDGSISEQEEDVLNILNQTVYRGGDFNSEEDKCSLDHVSTIQPTLMGLRLVLEN